MKSVSNICFVCENCINSCPVNAISFSGTTPFDLKAYINETECIHCGKCSKVCPALNLKQFLFQDTKEAYAFVSTQKEAQESTSGGVFFELAKTILSRGGCAAGAAYQNDWSVATEIISNEQDLKKLQGSKYVKSYNRDSFTKIKEIVQSGQEIIFGGTPCQIAALHSFLNDIKNADNLITIDLVCHGCPPGKLFKEYISHLEKDGKNIITYFSFRVKKYGSKHVGQIVSTSKRHKKTRFLYSSESSYFKLFLDGMTYLDSCYACPFARKTRISDITVSDFWGWKQECYETLKGKGVSENEPVSAVMIHTIKGRALFKEIAEHSIVEKVDFESIAKQNPNLCAPSKAGAERTDLIELYEKKNYEGIEEYFSKKSGLKKYSLRISCFLPESIKKIVKKYFFRVK